MFQFTGFPSTGLCVQPAMHRHAPVRVSPFGHFRLKRLHTPYRNLSQCTTSFIGTVCLGIHHTPLVALSLLSLSTEKLKLSLSFLPLAENILLRLLYNLCSIHLLRCIVMSGTKTTWKFSFTGRRYSANSGHPTAVYMLCLSANCANTVFSVDFLLLF